MTNEPSTADIPKNPAERREWIKYRLRVQLGTSFRRVALEFGCSLNAISRAAGGYPSERMEAYLAGLLGIPQHLLFSEHYRGTVRIPAARPIHTKRSAPEDSRNVQTRGAA